jgi:hypothetical protein
VELRGLEPLNLLTASQALYQLSYSPVPKNHNTRLTSLTFPKAVRAPIVVAGSDIRVSA